MFLSAKFIFINLIFLFYLLSLIVGDCFISLPDNSNLKPKFLLNAGSHKININTGDKNILKLYNDQKLEVYCESKFEWPEHYKNHNKLFVKCQWGNTYIAIDENYKVNSNSYSSPNFKCSWQKWNLYESDSNFNWCPINATSYVLARPEPWNPKTAPFNKLAGICYDIYNLTLYSVYYTLAPNGSADVQPSVLRDYYQPATQIDYVKETFTPNTISANMLEEGQLKKWITTTKYDYCSIIQHLKLNSSFNDQFASVLEFLWWPNLRLYNWKHYIEALEDHIEDDNKSYDILAGISGTLKAPFHKSCQENYTMREVWLKTNRNVPLYVWNYLQDRFNSTNEVVIIGFNSPFYEFYSPDDVIFCPDRCNEISWLKKVKSSFHYNIMGIVFCCSVEDVRASKVLYGFPQRDLKPKPKLELPPSTNKPKLVAEYESED